MRPWLAVASVAALVVVPGCIELRDALLGEGPTPVPCGVARVDVAVNVEGAHRTLRHVVLQSESLPPDVGDDPQSSIATSCVPAFRETLVGTGADSARGRVDAQRYEEARLVWTDSVLRIGAVMEAAHGGTLNVTLTDGGGSVAATWNGTQLDVRRVERAAPAATAQDLRIDVNERLTGSAMRVVAFDVNSSWNQGAEIELTVLRGGPVDAPHDNFTGARVVARLLAPDGREEGTLVVDNAERRAVLRVDDVSAGIWRIEVNERAPPEDVDARYHVAVRVTY